MWTPQRLAPLLSRDGVAHRCRRIAFTWSPFSRPSTAVLTALVGPSAPFSDGAYTSNGAPRHDHHHRTLWRAPLPDALPQECCTVRTSRGSGPGGQAVNSSSNKVELRVAVSRLEPYVHMDLLAQLRAAAAASSANHRQTKTSTAPRAGTNAASADVYETDGNRSAFDRDDVPTPSCSGLERHVSSKWLLWDSKTKEATLFVSAHQHRSARQNELACQSLLLERLIAFAQHVERQQRTAAADAAEAVVRQRGRTYGPSGRMEVRYRDTKKKAPPQEDSTCRGEGQGSGADTAASAAPLHVDPLFRLASSSSGNISVGKTKRRKKAVYQRMQRAARRGNW